MTESAAEHAAHAGTAVAAEEPVPPPGWDCHVHVFDGHAPPGQAHYAPHVWLLQCIESVAAEGGCGHLVLVQPSVYGHDNTLLLRALAASGARHRGVVVLPDHVDEGALDVMHTAGVRGVRLNLVSPVGESPHALQSRVASLMPLLRARQWHLQWYVRAEQLPQVAAWHEDSGVVAVLDHLAGLGPDLSDEHPAWPALRSLAQQGAWVKLSGWYRLGAVHPYAELLPFIRRVYELFEGRCVWGSDWPHTSFAAEAIPSYASTWWPVVQALGENEAGRLRSRQPPLYR